LELTGVHFIYGIYSVVVFLWYW